MCRELAVKYTVNNLMLLSSTCQVSKHPELNEYITESLKSVRLLIRHGCLKSVVVCFYNKEEVPVERFVFDVLNVQANFRSHMNM